MPLPVIADHARVVWNWISDLGTSPSANNVMHVHAPGMTTLDIFNAITANWNQDLIAPVYSTGIVESFDITLLDGSPDADQFPTGSGVDYTGSGGTQAIVQGCTLIKLGTGGGGRSGRGRLYLPWIGEQSQDSGIVDPSTVTATTAAWVAFANDLIADDLTLAVASYTHSTARDVVVVNCEPTIATQRRRLHRP